MTGTDEDYLEVDGPEFSRTASYNVAVTHGESALTFFPESPDPTESDEASKMVAESGDGEDEKSDQGPKATFKELFRYATPRHRRLIAIAVVCSLVQGAGMPAWTVIFGEQLNSFGPGEEDLVDKMVLFLWVGVISGAALGTLAGTAVYCFNVVGAEIAVKTREEFVRAVLRNDATWHANEENRPAKLKARLEKSVLTLQAATSSQLNFALMGCGMFFFGLLIAFFYSWKLTLVFMIAIPLEMLGYGMLMGMMASIEQFNTKIYEDGARIADEVLSLIRTVKLFNAIEKEAASYKEVVMKTAMRGRSHGFRFGISLALTDPMEFFLYALGFWYGAELIREGDVDVGDILIALYCTLTGVMGLATLGGYTEQVAKAQSAAGSLYNTIDHPTSIDGLDESGESPDGVTKSVTFEKVTFRYPGVEDDDDSNAAVSANGEVGRTRNAVKGLSFTAKMGETIALVGRSGSGKSTVANLLLRLYDPQSGSILIDGKPLPSLNVQWVRTVVGLVQQQPILLPGTIFDNIAAGKHDATRDEVEEAAKLANAHDFIMSFNNDYDTDVGSLGNTLSGGQQQRIAIARTLIGNPPILVLDEATSALDSRSEAKLQQLLHETQDNRITIVIAHRLSTVRDADRIIVMDNGLVVESGSPDELLDKQGVYHSMVMQQGASRTDSDVGAPEIEDAAAASKRKSSAVVSKEVAKQGVKAATMEEPVDEEKHDFDKYKGPATSWAWKISRRHFGWLFMGILAAFLSGFGWPAVSFILAKIIKISSGFFEERDFSCDTTGATQFFNTRDECIYVCAGSRDCWGCAPFNSSIFTSVTGCAAVACQFGCVSEQIHPADEDEINQYVLAVVVVAAVSFVLLFIRGYATYVAGEYTALHTREDLFDNFVRRSAAWHDQQSEAVLGETLGKGALSTRHITSDAYSPYAAMFALIGGGIGVAFWGCPALAGVMLVIMPFLGGAAMLQMATAVGGEESGSIPQLVPSGELASSIIMHSSLVAALGRAADYYTGYSDEVRQLSGHYHQSALKAAGANFCMQLIMFSAFGIAFYVGAVLVDDGTCNVDGMIQAVFGLIFCTYVAGMQATHVPNTKESLKAAVRAYKLLTEGDIEAVDTGKPIDVKSGHLVLKDLHFAYPSRPDSAVLQGLNLTVHPGETVALVGGSGSGKSTVLLLLQKLYSLQSGTIELDGVDISTIDTSYLRRQIAVVSQEVRLFDRTILENIAYRPPKDGKEPPVEDVRRQVEIAAGTANATEFIADKEGGLDFRVGHRGDKLSGGQKQRVSIARALFGETAGGPRLRLVLLDEATSALDAESEHLVQAALEELQQGRSTIVVAHRLNTIKGADRICVISEGVIAEEGTFEQLVEDQSSLFYQFYREHLENQ